MPPKNLLKNWTDEHAAQMHEAIFVAEHRLAEVDLFNDEELARTLDAHPLESGVVSAETIEAVLCGDKSEEIEYRSEFDQRAVVVDLEPGQVISWPHHTPHRVVNTGGLNVSLSTEHMTRRTVRKNNVYLANRHFRRMLGGGFTSTKVDGLVPAVNEFAIRAARRLPLVAPEPPRGFKHPITFQVDPDAPDGVRPIAAQHAATPPTASGEMPIVIPITDAPDFHVPTMG